MDWYDALETFGNAGLPGYAIPGVGAITTSKLPRSIPPTKDDSTSQRVVDWHSLLSPLDRATASRHAVPGVGAITPNLPPSIPLLEELAGEGRLRKGEFPSPSSTVRRPAYVGMGQRSRSDLSKRDNQLQRAGQLRQSNDANDARINEISRLRQAMEANAREQSARAKLEMDTAKARSMYPSLPVGAGQGFMDEREQNRAWGYGASDDIRRAEYRANRGRAPGQQVDARWLLGGLSVGGQRPEETGGDPLEQVQQLVSQNRPMSGMNRDQLRERQDSLFQRPKYGVGSVAAGGRGSVKGMDSLTTLPGQGYRDQKTRIALHGPSSQHYMNQMGIGADEQAAIRKAAADQKTAAYANTIRMKEKIRANRQLSALNNARQMAGSLDPRRQFQSQMILDRQLRESDAGPGGDPMQRYIDKVSRMNLHPKDAAALIQQQQNFLNQLELERQRQYGNIEAGKASGAIDPKYVNPFGSPVASSGRPADLPVDTGPAPAGAAPAPAAAPQYRSLRDRIEAEKRKRGIVGPNPSRTEMIGLRG